MAESHKPTSDRSTRCGVPRATATPGVAAPYFVSAAALGSAGAPGANDKIHIALIGCGGMGRGNLANCARHPDVVVASVCEM